ncbi:MAG: hypothetical protein LBC37_06310 [Zoogloeaceae bacterium]|jgi:aspartate aminotransferase|nr:hypothetical protein [Zoogloeaceae bacterium]
MEYEIDLEAIVRFNVDVVTIPGAPFGMPGYIRMSFATSQQNIRTAFERIKESLGRLI